ncbi:MAG: ComC/BlpC family leader-containing pheromone/bacteriocin [Oligoflexales bacterium]
MKLGKPKTQCKTLEDETLQIVSGGVYWAETKVGTQT